MVSLAGMAIVPSAGLAPAAPAAEAGNISAPPPRNPHVVCLASGAPVR